MPLAHQSLSPQHEKMLWDKRELNMDSSRGLSRAVIFYLIKCFAIWQGKELRQLDTSHVTFGEDDLGIFVALDLQNTTFKQKKMIKRYDDPANPRSVYKILKKYRSYVANEGPFLVRPITSIKDFICYSPLPLGVNVIESAVSTLMKDAGIGLRYVNYSLNLQAVDTLLRFGTGSHCLASWLFKNGMKGMPPAPSCGPTNCEDSNPEISLMMSRLLDAPYPFDAVEIIQKMEQEEEQSQNPQPHSFDSWMTNLLTSKNLGRQSKADKKKASGKKSKDGGKEKPVSSVEVREKNAQLNNKRPRKSCDSTSSSSHSSVSSPPLTSDSNKDSSLKISSVSSISEGAFSTQVDEADNGGNSTCVVKRKRKLLEKDNLRSPTKRLRGNCEKKTNDKCVKSNTPPSIKVEIVETSSDDALVQSFILNEKTSEGEVSEKCNSWTLITDVKKEIVDNDESMCEEKGSIESADLIDDFNKSSENFHPTQHSEDARSKITGDGKESETENISSDLISKPGAMKSDIKETSTISDHPSCGLTSVAGSDSCVNDTKKRCQGTEVFRDKGELSQSEEKKLRDSIAILRELRHDRCNKDRAKQKVIMAVDEVANPVCKVVESNQDCTDDDESQALFEENMICESELVDSKEGESGDCEDYTIDLSPPVLSPQVPITPSDVGDVIFDDADEKKSNDTETETIVLNDAVSNRHGLSAMSSSCPSSSSSDIMVFLDNAYKQIEGLLNASSHTSHTTTNLLGKRKDILTPSSAKIRIKDQPGKRAKQSSLHSDDTHHHAKNKTPQATTAAKCRDHSAISASSSSCNITTNQQNSLLRSCLERPQESVTASTSIPSSSSSSFPCMSRLQTCLLPKAISSNAVPDCTTTTTTPRQSCTSSSEPKKISTKNKDESSHSCTPGHVENDHHSSQQLRPTKSNSTFSHLPVKVVLNNTSSSSSSSSSLSSSLNSPITLVLNSATSSSESSSSPPTLSIMPNITSVSNALTSSSPLPTTSSTAIGSSATTRNDLQDTAIFQAKQDAALNTLYQSLEVFRPEADDDVQLYNFADVPNASGPPMKTKSFRDRGGRVDTSEINLGDYFPPGTLIPASSVQIVTRQVQSGSEMVLRFGFKRNGHS